MKHYRKLALLGGFLAVSIGGCTTAAPPPRPVYQHVPCSTPGARLEIPVPMDQPAQTSGKTQATDGAPSRARPVVRCVVEAR
jgi:hypothetical protein